MKRLCPKVPEMDDLFRTPEHAISRICEKMRIVKPNGKGMDFDFDGIVLDRVAHDEALVELARSKGADYLLGKRVKRVEGDAVVLSNGIKMRGKVIVGAGGHNDPIRKKYWDERSLNIPVKFALKNGVILTHWSCTSDLAPWRICMGLPQELRVEYWIGGAKKDGEGD